MLWMWAVRFGVEELWGCSSCLPLSVTLESLPMGFWVFSWNYLQQLTSVTPAPAPALTLTVGTQGAFVECISESRMT